MRKITVFIDNGDSKVVHFQETILTDTDLDIPVKHAVLFWDYKNVDSSNNQVLYNSVTKMFPSEYWTFFVIKKEIESYGNVTLNENSYNSVTLTSDRSTYLKQFGLLLGFSANTSTKSN